MPFLRCQNHTPFSVSPSHIYVCAFLVPFETHMQEGASKRFLPKVSAYFLRYIRVGLARRRPGVNSKNLRKLNKRAAFDIHKFFGKRLHCLTFLESSLLWMQNCNGICQRRVLTTCFRKLFLNFVRDKMTEAACIRRLRLFAQCNVIKLQNSNTCRTR